MTNRHPGPNRQDEGRTLSDDDISSQRSKPRAPLVNSLGIGGASAAPSRRAGSPQGSDSDAAPERDRDAAPERDHDAVGDRAGKAERPGRDGD
jgi:hypothetical protein